MRVRLFCFWVSLVICDAAFADSTERTKRIIADESEERDRYGPSLWRCSDNGDWALSPTFSGGWVRKHHWTNTKGWSNVLLRAVSEKTDNGPRLHSYFVKHWERYAASTKDFLLPAKKKYDAEEMQAMMRGMLGKTEVFESLSPYTSAEYQVSKGEGKTYESWEELYWGWSDKTDTNSMVIAYIAQHEVDHDVKNKFKFVDKQKNQYDIRVVHGGEMVTCDTELLNERWKHGNKAKNGMTLHLTEALIISKGSEEYPPIFRLISIGLPASVEKQQRKEAPVL